MRNVICLIVATAILGATTLDARENGASAVPSGKASAEQTSTVKERLLEVPPGSMIEVRLLNKKKIRGKLGQINNEGFNLTAVEQGKIVTRKIAFSEMKSFKQVESAKTKAGHTLLYVLAGVGALVVILVIWGAARTE